MARQSSMSRALQRLTFLTFLTFFNKKLYFSAESVISIHTFPLVRRTQLEDSREC